MQLAFCNVSKGGSYYRAKKHSREDLILQELLSDNLSDVPEDIFQRKRFCDRNKNCAVRKKYSESGTSSKESDSTLNVGATTWVKEDKTLNLGPFTGNSI
jgi:hypothetical protein